MDNNKGLTLIEVVISISIVGVIAIVFFKTIAFGYTNIVKSDKFTKDSFRVQEEMEQAITELKNTDVDLSLANTEQKTIFGKKVKGHIKKIDIESSDTGKHGEYTAFIPRVKVEYNLPELGTVSVGEIKLGTAMPGKVYMIDLVDSSGDINYTLEFKGNEPIIKNNKNNHLMNVYKWYVSPYAKTDGKNADITNPENPDIKEVNAFINANRGKSIVIKEWNSARQEQDYVLDDFSMITNLKDNYKTFRFYELKISDVNSDGKTKRDVILDMFAGKFLTYSVTPYSVLGKMGQEVFSEPIYIKKPEGYTPPSEEDVKHNPHD